MNKLFKFGNLLIIAMMLFSCKTPTPKDLAKENLIPKPTKLIATGSSFELTDETVIYVQGENEGIKQVGN